MLVGRLAGVVLVLSAAVAVAEDEWWDAEPVTITFDTENGGVIFDASGTKTQFPRRRGSSRARTRSSSS